jgi:hypothetical protein
MSVIKIIELQPNFQAQPPSWTVLNLFKERVVQSIKEICYSGIFKHPTGALANSIRGYVSGNSVYVIADATYAKAQEEGVQPHTMWQLLGKTIPLRIFRFGQSRLIFRKASVKSYLRGAWRHPGTEGKYFIREGIRQAISEFDEPLSNYNVWVRDM